MNINKFYFLFCLTLRVNANFNFNNFGVDEVLDVLIPTTRSENVKCRNDSLLYLEELKNMKLWATEMFDASSKFPTGILFGSAFDFGNFDECVEVSVPITGQYCLAKFHITPPEFVKNHDEFYYRFDDKHEDGFVNATTWEKIVEYSNDRTRRTRDDFYFSYCLPSSCRHEDLEASLKEVTEKINALSDFKVAATVDKRNCQIKTSGFDFSTSDFAFMLVVGIFAVLAISATIYDWLMKLDDLQKYKFTGRRHKMAISFSIWTNLQKLDKKPEDHNGLQCINGMKVVSMFLIIMGHRIMFGIGSPIVNPNFVEKLYGRVETTVLLNGPIIVDTFFNISGFLASYLMLTEFSKRRKSVNIFYLYLHRFIRLTPAYAVVLGFYCTLFIKTGSGPLWQERVQMEQERCLASWWANLIYLNNYINKDQLCMFQSWYMTCDMHFFILAPFFIWLLRKRPHIGLATLFAIIIVSISVVFAVVFINNEDGILLLYMKLLRDPVLNNTFKNIYIPTHMRASPYFVGLLTGYIKYKMRTTSYKMPKYMVYMGWIMCVFVIEITVYSAFIFYIPGKPYNPFISATYASMHHFTWSICISWMIIAISEGNGAWIEPILSWRGFTPLSRVTYTAFLCHGAIQIYSAAVRRQAWYSSIFNLIFFTAADITLAYVCGLVLSMVFEAPIIAIEKLLKEKRPDSIPEHRNGNSNGTVPKIKIINDY